MLASRNGLKQKSRRHNSAAIYGHYRNVERKQGADEGNVSVGWFEHGCFRRRRNVRTAFIGGTNPVDTV